MARLGNGSGQGRSWGGPAKGAHPAKPRHDFDKQAGPGRGHYSVAGEGRLERQARHSEICKEVLFGLVADPITEDNVRVQAATKLLDRLEGLPVQRVLTAETDPISMMGDEQLEDEIERTRLRAQKLAELRSSDTERIALPRTVTPDKS